MAWTVTIRRTRVEEATVALQGPKDKAIETALKIAALLDAGMKVTLPNDDDLYFRQVSLKHEVKE